MKKRDINPNFFNNNNNNNKITNNNNNNIILSNNNKNQSNNNKQSINISNYLRIGRETGIITITNNNLNEFPLDICNYQSSYISNNEKFWEINELIKLDLSYNNINRIPNDINILTSLITLRLRNNQLIELPNGLYDCILLKYIDIQSNQIKSIDSLIYKLNQLIEFNISNNQLTNIPNTMNECKCLQLLDLSNNKLKQLPNDFYLPMLIKLYINNNQLIYLPNSLNHMISLSIIDCSNNKLIDLPDLFNLSNLLLLNISNNLITNLSTIPTNKLDKLISNYNNISNININYLSNYLTELHLSNNQLSNIPIDIYQLDKLILLDISNNNINDLPYTLGYMTTLNKIVVHGNPIKTIRQSLLVQSTNDLKTYLRTRGTNPNDNNKAYINTYSNIDSYNNASSNKAISKIDSKLDRKVVKVDSNVDSGINVNLYNQLEYRVFNILNHKLDLSKLIASTNQSNKSIDVYINSNAFINVLTQLLIKTNYYNQSTNCINDIMTIDISNNRLNNQLFKDLLYFLTTICISIKSLYINNNSLNLILTDLSNQSTILSTSLIYIDISNNQLTNQQFEYLLTYCMNIQEINCSNNNLTCLPTNIFTNVNIYNNLRILNLSYNKINTLKPIRFSLYKSIESIDLSNNLLTNISTFINCNTLKSLQLNNNNIVNIPYELGLLTNLTSIQLYGNPQKIIRSNQLNNTNVILQSLRNKLPIDSNTIDYNK